MDTSDPKQRSAFSNVIKSKHMETSPPLSPASSMSSIADETSLNATDTSLNTTPKTPSTTYMSAFPTPPSGGSSISTILTHSNDSSPSSVGRSICCSVPI